MIGLPREESPAEQLLIKIQDCLEIIRTMNDLETGERVNGFGCEMELQLKSGRVETWEVEFKRIPNSKYQDEGEEEYSG